MKVIEETIRLGGRLLMMEEQNELIGTAWITNNGRRLYLHHMGIKPNKQGRGWGQYLMEEILAFARSTHKQIKLEVHQQNGPARKLYEKYGFAELEGYQVLINRNTAK
ncbi:MAG: GNAT family N-acetyltransferase [Bacteroidales bacterium]|nr:GNAT family N-acetyltransferase [Bacteroidales bacterium]